MIAKSLAELIDELITTSMKIYMLIDKVHTKTHTLEDASNIQELNRKRSQLKNAINEFTKEGREIKL